MDLDEFWALLTVVGPRPSDEDFERLTDRLATRGPDDICAFEDRLAAALSALDTPAHAAAAKANGDWFLYVRCAAVAAGRDAYAEVLAEPARLRRFAHREAELLLGVAQQAFERRTGMLWEHESPVSYESGSNAAAWGEPEPSLPERVPEPRSWLRVHATVFRRDGWPAAYVPLVRHVGQVIGADPAWEAWWSAAGIPECQLSLLEHETDDFGPVGVTVAVGRTRIEATAVAVSAPFASTEPEQLLPRAVSAVTGLFEAVRARLDLAPPPPARVTELPVDLPEGLEHPMDLSAVGPGRLLRALAGGLVARFRRRGPGARS
ncbi:DUF4240 domain-containing protein [Krasilnikovia sp. MM14-A1259]|uniref:DUF4240 domain-containing protein n=1 Tax=Krasilnikovia sp. MM14-A1259 TaxID=3373539 RepID=UPI0037F9045B